MDNNPNRDMDTGQFGIKHGLYHHPFYPIWRAMKDRCENPKNMSYLRYGGRGITIYAKWQDISVFIAWLETNGYQKGLEIDREDNDLGYSPDNCRIVTPQQNSRNRRDNKRYLVHGEMLLAIEIEEKYEVKWATFRARIDRYGKTPEEALINKRKLPVYSYIIHGKPMTTQEIYKKFGVSPSNFSQRIGRGWSPERAAVSSVQGG